MRILVTFWLLVFTTQAARAVDLTCTVPAAVVSRGVELCSELRLTLRVRAADWNNNVCATEFLRLGFLQAEKTSTRRAAQAAVRDAVTTAIDTFDARFPRTPAAVCGDGTLDVEFGEECDDGDNDDGDGCGSRCKNE